MNKKLLAVAIAASAFGTQAVAVELYNNDGSTFSMGGHVSVNVNGSEAEDASVGTNSPRINFGATQDLGNGFTAEAKGEWDLNLLENSDESFTTRLGYIGVTHAEYGSTYVGTQWAPFYDVAGVTDLPIAFANDFLYTGDDFAKTGQTRADNMVSYRNGMDFGNAGALNVGIGWQGTADSKTATGITEYSDRVQFALSYAIMGANLGYAYSTGDVKGLGGASGALDYHVFSAAYGSYGNGLYLAGVYQLSEDKYVTREESDSYELIAAYALANSLNLSVNYETVEITEKVANTKSTDREELALQAEHHFTSKFVGYTGYQFDLKSEDGYTSDDKWVIGARYYL
ncbi:porin [Vibrio paucivorans]|uniref:Porin n=1 Tax=Vibrio paucivorans TaxID=2829489 RepID=A0A9X3CB35_9VIBR|nr:porin [Vibrio paucivorans]MCW8332406.1 porin [Vibrio paucivorans]